MKKKEKSPVLVVITIFVLLMFIALPPVFRAFIPKTEVKEKKPIKKDITVLVCSKQSVADGYQITSKVRYKKDIAIRNVIVFEEINSQEEGGAPESADSATTGISATQELKSLQMVPGISVTENGQSTTVVVDDALVNANSTNADLANYLLPLSDQQLFYESMNYTCTIEKS